MPMATSATVPHLDAEAEGRGKSRLRGKRVRVEALLVGTTAPEPLPVHDLAEADPTDQPPAAC